jgi:branched-chain amino acid transport system ATP-binding protein
MRRDSILQAKGLVKQFDGVQAVDRVDLSLLAGEVHALIGPNGAGKTTLLHLLAGNLQPDQGTVLFAGQDVTRWSAHRRARLGLARTFQMAAHFPALTVGEHLEASAQAGRLQLFARASEEHGRSAIVRSCQLEEKLDWPARELSHGDQRLLEVAMALCMKPTLLLLDEPAAGLSPAETATLIQLISRMEGMSILIVEHDMQVVFRLAGKITVMHRGRVLAEGPPEEIQRNPQVQEVYLGAS